MQAPERGPAFKENHMRVRMSQIIHLNRARRQKLQALKMEPDNTDLRCELQDLEDKLFNDIVEELLELYRDAADAKSAAQRAGRFPR